jgi:hypothetical protein
MTMRLAILEKKIPILARLLTFVIRGRFGTVPGPLLVQTYTRNYIGRELAAATEEAMRRSSEWEVWEVELFAAFISKLNRCRF